MRKLIVFIATSLDGYIAAPDDDLNFLSVVKKEGEDYGYNYFIQTVDTVIMGRKTYDWINKQDVEFPHADKETYIFTHKVKPQKGKTVFYSGDVKELVENLKLMPGKNIYCDGGAETINSLMAHHLVDEFILSVVPVLLGGGVRLFQPSKARQDMILLTARKYSTGLVQLHYQLKPV